MFTGIVEELGRLAELRPGSASIGMRFDAPRVAADLRIGDSVAVNGCCLTVVEHGAGWFAVDAVGETLGRTNLGTMAVGDPVNLERAMALGDRLGGHIVQGHVDGTGTVLRPAPHLEVSLPPALAPYCVAKGSIALDGCSLTVVEAGSDHVGVEIIPHTQAVTTLGVRKAGALINVEVDVVAKYVERLVRAGVPSPYLPVADPD